MKIPKYIRHVTLQTGDTRDSYRAEVRADVIALCRVLIAEALAASPAPVPIPQCPGYGYSAAPGPAGALLSAVWAGPAVLVVFNLAIKSRSSAQVWQSLHQGAINPATDPAQWPDVPWLGVSVRLEVLTHPDAADWLGDFERCIAWAWIERQAEH